MLRQRSTRPTLTVYPLGVPGSIARSTQSKCIASISKTAECLEKTLSPNPFSTHHTSLCGALSGKPPTVKIPFPVSPSLCLRSPFPLPAQVHPELRRGDSTVVMRPSSVTFGPHLGINGPVQNIPLRCFLNSVPVYSGDCSEPQRAQ